MGLMELTEKELKACRDAGFELGNNLVTQAVKTASNERELSGQIRIARNAAIYILAQEAFNHMKQDGVDFEAFMSVASIEIERAMDKLKEAEANGEMSFVHTDGSRQ